MTDTAQIVGIVVIILTMANGFRIVWKWSKLFWTMGIETVLMVVGHFVLALLVGMVIF